MKDPMAGTWPSRRLPILNKIITTLMIYEITFRRNDVLIVQTMESFIVVGCPCACSLASGCEGSVFSVVSIAANNQTRRWMNKWRVFEQGRTFGFLMPRSALSFLQLSVTASFASAKHTTFKLVPTRCHSSPAAETLRLARWSTSSAAASTVVGTYKATNWAAAASNKGTASAADDEMSCWTSSNR